MKIFNISFTDIDTFSNLSGEIELIIIWVMWPVGVAEITKEKNYELGFR